MAQDESKSSMLQAIARAITFIACAVVEDLAMRFISVILDVVVQDLQLSIGDRHFFDLARTRWMIEALVETEPS